MKILVLNMGSSSAKYKLYDWSKRKILCKGKVDGIFTNKTYTIHETLDSEPVKIKTNCQDHQSAIALILRILISPNYGVIKDHGEITAVGHRVVHGGDEFSKSILIDEEVIKRLEKFSRFAPLHNPANIQGIKATFNLLPGIPNVATFDTAWHQTMKEAQYMYALPYNWYQDHKIRRYGFHGLSFLYVARRASALLGKNPCEVNLISLHIGSGASANAVKEGVSFDTSMGFTPLEGLVMGTRSGDHDPAIGYYMMDELDLSRQEIELILNNQSGVFGITGKHKKQTDILDAMEQGDKRAKLAFELTCYRIKKYIGQYLATLGRVDAIVWTAGIGELDQKMRSRVLEGLEAFGIEMDLEKNLLAQSQNAEFDISATNAKIRNLIIPTDEELVCAEDVVAILENRCKPSTEAKYSFQEKSYRNTHRDSLFQMELEKTPEMVKARIIAP